MIRRTILWPAALALLTIAVSVVTFTGVFSSSRPLVAVPYLFLCPGMVWVRLLGVRSELHELLLGIALSLSIDTIVATAFAYADVPSARVSLAVLVAVTIGGLAFDPSVRGFLRPPARNGMHEPVTG
jgi:hypothetical protein